MKSDIIVILYYIEPKENRPPVAVIKPRVLNITDETTGILDGAGECVQLVVDAQLKVTLFMTLLGTQYQCQIKRFLSYIPLASSTRDESHCVSRN